MKEQKMIKIGIASSFLYPYAARHEALGPKTMIYTVREMPRLVARSGVMPILIPDLDDPQLLREFLDQMDGFLFTGGNDLAPESYGENPLNSKCEGDSERDRHEFEVIDYAVRNRRPVLGICRGMQLINVYFGGTLHQDIAHDLPKALKHQDYALFDELIHSISLVPGGLLEKLYGARENIVVNSIHHQAVKVLGKGLRVEAMGTEDEVIESISDGERVLGVQWHPEFPSASQEQVLSPIPLVDYFISLCEENLSL